MAGVNRFVSIEQVTDQYLNQTSGKVAKPSSDVSFQEIFSKKQRELNGGELRFSKHASQRLNDRNIDLSEDQLNRLETGAQMAEEKGIKDSLIMVDSLAFIVNIPSQVVVTAIDKEETTNNIYTNIDGAVVI